tara:strand:+ start:1102 stop:1644 length:543 start_codon:yes stop_codon:yes gene_type:complete
MASSSIQEYIFENKEEIPDGIYKGIQDLLKKQHEEEQKEGLFEVKYFEVSCRCQTQQKSWGKMMEEDVWYDWDIIDARTNKDYEKQNMSYIYIDLYSTRICTKLVKIEENENNEYFCFNNLNIITPEMYNDFEENDDNLRLFMTSMIRYTAQPIDKIGRTLRSSRKYYHIFSIEPYKYKK